jgi:hypothetical protein
MTDAAVKAGSRAHGRSAPSTAFGGSSSGGGGGVVATTTYAGGQAASADWFGGGEVLPGGGGGGEVFPGGGGGGGGGKLPGGGGSTAPVKVPRSAKPWTAPTTPPPPGRSRPPSVSAVSIGRTEGLLKTILPPASPKPTAVSVARGAVTAAKADPKPKVVARPAAKKVVVPAQARRAGAW